MLYDILTNRVAVNLLKELSEKDKKKQYSVKISYLGANNVRPTLELLSSNGLVYIEDDLVAISAKGKSFIDAFDRLVELFRQQEKRKSNVEVQYDLTDFEKKTLLMLFRLQQETSKPVSLYNITRELYPYENASSKKSYVSRQIAKMEELNLVEKIKIQREAHFQITYTGMKVAKSQLVTEISKIL